MFRVLNPFGDQNEVFVRNYVVSFAFQDSADLSKNRS